MNEILTTIVGNVASAPTRRRTADGVELASFRLASNVRRFDRDAGEWVTTTTSFVTVTAWRRLGVNVGASFVKGDPVVVYGRLSTRDYVAKDGASRTDVEIDAYAIGPDLSRCTAAVARTRVVEGADGVVEDGVESVAAQEVPGPRDELGLGDEDPALDVDTDGDLSEEAGVARGADAASDDPWRTAAEPALAG